jgi:hypothetical protein
MVNDTAKVNSPDAVRTVGVRCMTLMIHPSRHITINADNNDLQTLPNWLRHDPPLDDPVASRLQCPVARQGLVQLG